jgi:hypothetical protein
MHATLRGVVAEAGDSRYQVTATRQHFFDLVALCPTDSGHFSDRSVYLGRANVPDITSVARLDKDSTRTPLDSADLLPKRWESCEDLSAIPHSARQMSIPRHWKTTKLLDVQMGT